MSKIYTSEGWVNWDYLYSQTTAFCMAVGPRATGKTYGLLKYMLDNKLKFIYLRRLRTQLDQCGTVNANPFKKINSDTGRCIQPYRDHGMIDFQPSEADERGNIHPVGPAVALGVALSTFATIRGADFSDIDCIVYDEAVPMAGEKNAPDEFTAFLNFYETVNRNRQLEGKQAVKCFLLGNANKLSNPYFTGWKFMRTALNMIAGRQMMWRSQDGSRIMVMLLDSPISNRKKQTALYHNGNSDFLHMAVDNAFRTDETNIRPVPLQELDYICSIGQVGIYQHKSAGWHYASAAVRKQNFYQAYGMSMVMWRHDYALMRILYMAHDFYFENYETELIFREYIGL